MDHVITFTLHCNRAAEHGTCYHMNIAFEPGIRTWTIFSLLHCFAARPQNMDHVIIFTLLCNKAAENGP